LVRRENLDRYDDRLNIRVNLIEAYDLLMDFVAKHLSDPFYLDGIQRVSLRDKIFNKGGTAPYYFRKKKSGAIPPLDRQCRISTLSKGGTAPYFFAHGTQAGGEALRGDPDGGGGHRRQPPREDG